VYGIQELIVGGREFSSECFEITSYFRNHVVVYGKSDFGMTLIQRQVWAKETIEKSNAFLKFSFKIVPGYRILLTMV